MKNRWIKLSSILVLGSFLAACGNGEGEEPTPDDTEEVTNDTDENEEDHNHDDDHDHEENQDHDDDSEHNHRDAEEAPESIEIEGLADHYHTGELVELTAVLDEETDYDHWHWYIRTGENDDWESIPDQLSENFVVEAPEETVEIRAVLFDNDHGTHAQSAPQELVVDNH